jgi:hypothetical protein
MKAAVKRPGSANLLFVFPEKILHKLGYPVASFNTVPDALKVGVTSKLVVINKLPIGLVAERAPWATRLSEFLEKILHELRYRVASF